MDLGDIPLSRVEYFEWLSDRLIALKHKRDILMQRNFLNLDFPYKLITIEAKIQALDDELII
jgi:hypothetical protein